MARKDLIVVIAGDNSDLLKKLRQVKRDLTDLGKDLSAIGSKLTTAITLPLLAVGAGAIKMAGDFEQAQIAFTTMLGSAEKARAFLGELEEFAKNTPFDFPGLVDASRRLIAMGFDAERVIPILTAVGNAAAATGVGAEGVDRITKALSQMAAKGKVSAEEMTQQLGEIIPAWQMLADEIGVSVPEAMKMAEKGMLDGKAAVEALTTAMMRQYPDAMKAQMTSLLGLVDRAKDQALMALKSLGEAMVPLAKQLMENLVMPVVGGFEKLVEFFRSLKTETQTTVILFAGLAAALGPVLFIAGGIATAIAGIMVIGAKVAAVIGGFVAAFVLAGAAAIIFRDKIADAWDKVVEFAESIKPQLIGALNEIVNRWQVAWAAMKMTFELVALAFSTVWSSKLFAPIAALVEFLTKRVVSSFLLMLQVGAKAVETILGLFESLAKQLQWLPGSIGAAAQEFLKTLADWRSGTDKVGAAMASMGQAVADAKNKAGELIGEVKGALPPLGSFKNVIREAAGEAKNSVQRFDDSRVAIDKYKDKAKEAADKFKEFIAEAYDLNQSVREQKQALDEAVQGWYKVNPELAEAVAKMTAMKPALSGVNTEALKAADNGKKFSEAFNAGTEKIKQLRAELAWIGDQLKNQNLSLEDRNRLAIQMNAAQDELNGLLGVQKERTDDLAKVGRAAFRAFQDMGFAVRDALMGGKELMSELGSAMKQLAADILDIMIQGSLNKMKDAILEQVQSVDVLRNAWKKLGDVLSGGGGGDWKTPGAPGGDWGGKGGGSGAGGLSGIIGMVTGIAQTITGIFQSFQFAAMNKTLDLIEREVRESKIHLSYILGTVNDEFHRNVVARHNEIKELLLRLIGVASVSGLTGRSGVVDVRGGRDYRKAEPLPVLVDWAEATRTFVSEELLKAKDALLVPLNLIRQRLDDIHANTLTGLIVPELERQSSTLTSIYGALSMGETPPVIERIPNLKLGDAKAAGLTVNISGAMKKGQYVEMFTRELEAFGIPD